jgi:hypothetical protein
VKNRRNYYRILQVQPDAPAAILRASYKALMRELRLHPDLGGEHWNAAVLNEAYQTLGDPLKRSAYDRQLFEHYTKTPVEGEKPPVMSYFCPFCKRPLARQAGPHDLCTLCASPLAGRGDAPDRRAIERVNKSGSIQVYGDWMAEAAIGAIVNLSPQGMQFFCPEQPVPGATVQLFNASLRAVGLIRHIRRHGAPGQRVYEVGVEFVSVVFTEFKGQFYSTLM